MKTVAVRAEEIDFDAAAREHRPFLLQIAVASTRNASDAEDVVQEALMRGYRGIKRFRGDCPLRIWLSRIVVRAISTIFGQSSTAARTSPSNFAISLRSASSFAASPQRSTSK